mgnify:FL=1
MQIEYEAIFTNIDKEDIRAKLRAAGAQLIYSEILQKRVVFNLPVGHEIKGGWLRVRDEGDKITMSLKVVDGNKIENQKELCLKIDNFDMAVAFLESIGCERKSFQESKRELWQLDGADITIDEWPFLEPYVEIEGQGEAQVKALSEKLGFDYSQTLFCSVDTLYIKKYGITFERINSQTPLITFNGPNPFL